MISVEHKGDVALLRLSHGKVNALDVELLDALDAALAALATSSARAVVVTGDGRAFCAGVDLLRVLDGGDTYVDTLIPALGRAFESLFTFPKPTVAAVNGPAIAGGCIVACACDRRVVAEDAVIGASELRVGVPFPAAALEIVRHCCGRHTDTVLLGAGLVRGEPARALGLADELVPADQVVDRSMALADELAALQGPGYALAKAQLRAPALGRIRAGAADDARVRRLWATPETAAAIRTSLERTTGKAR
ncbi:MAG TPA: enoyl-CoA hydratase/isomerase family protein [Acidimicrobiales bacterium]|nr:enoyl-CoA hydratase/isomerase family protein [Acidimicrobiales bacterium]